MAQTTVHPTPSSFPLPDAYSSALVSIFDEVRPGIVQVQTEQRGGGTGFIWHKDGRIITNNHVTPNANDKVQVHLIDGRTLEARVLQRNPQLDLALLKVNGDNLKTLPVGNSSTLRIGEWVFAIGHPWGQRWALTAGIVSALSSVKLADNLTTHYIKSDVRLAPGNSGGPLINADGQVVGINAMIFGGDLSVSIPSNVMSTWLAGLPKSPITLGIEIQTVGLPENVLQALQPHRESGLLVVGIGPERQSQYSDLLIGDILLDVAGKPMNDAAALRTIIAHSEDGKPVAMKILRGGIIIHADIVTLARS
ncbi:MAG TPA: trypsin-like peptidase domain-containing protein [Ktedonobacteraceae bacterium]|jgi:serine protease Do|nr:trypsin-like peptidase domain-containing protein [Ktedonobacteraceae bacterium]